jgi:hypothetical protein
MFTVWVDFEEMGRKDEVPSYLFDTADEAEAFIHGITAASVAWDKPHMRIFRTQAEFDAATFRVD